MMIGRNIHLTQNEGKEHEGELNIPQSIVPVPQPKKRKLVLHLDLNNTILVSDAATGQGPRAALNSYLSTVTWGKLSDSGEWCWLSDSLSLTVPCKDAISYYLQFGRNADFADTKMGKKFKEVFDHHLEKLEWKGEPNETFSQKGEDGKLYHWILPSFFHLLENLHQQGRDFCILLRTFGVDLPRLLPLIHSALMGQHPHFPQLRELPIHIDLTPGKIRCSAREAVLTQGPHRLSTKKNEGTLYEYFSNLSGIGGFQDHFDWWARKNFTSEGGKPFWIDPNDGEAQHIFIDDNIRLSEGDTIVNSRVLLDQNPNRQSRKAPTSELYDICLVQTDLLQAIDKEDYFLECIGACEENYERYLANFPCKEA